LKYISKESLLKWKKDVPTLEQKLSDFCAGFPSATALLKSKKMDRRALKRVKLSGKVQIQLLNRSGEPIEDYSIHVKFDKMLDQSVINSI